MIKAPQALKGIKIEEGRRTGIGDKASFPGKSFSLSKTGDTEVPPSRTNTGFQQTI